MNIIATSDNFNYYTTSDSFIIEKKGEEQLFRIPHSALKELVASLVMIDEKLGQLPPFDQ